jgi:hypothetical protein
MHIAPLLAALSRRTPPHPDSCSAANTEGDPVPLQPPSR